MFSLGAGSVLETLQAGRPLIVVINELLMDNHQMELASQLAEDGHLFYATCRCGQISGHIIYTRCIHLHHVKVVLRPNCDPKNNSFFLWISKLC